MKRFLMVAATLAGPALAEPAPVDAAYWAEGRPAVAEILAQRGAECREMGDGAELVTADESRAFVETDLDGDGEGEYNRDDLVIDFNYIWCSLAVSLWGGTGGAPIHFVLDGTHAASWSGHVWDQVRLGRYYPSVILIARHGTACDGAGVSPCVQAVVAEDGAFWTVMYPQPNEGG